jgi:hypothetical protein
MFVDTYGTEGFDWAGETIRMEVEDDFDVKLPRPNFDRLMTAIALIKTDDFYQSLPDFINFCNILSGDSYDPRHWDPADAFEVAWGLSEAMLIHPPEDDEPFTDEIRAYIGEVLDDEGIMNAPDILKLALRGDENILERIRTDFSDDPGMFETIYAFEQGKTDDINTAIKMNLSRLAAQLEAAPLSDGNTDNVVQQMLSNLS